LVGLMGGTISVESTVGKGTIFTLLLPVRLGAGTPLSPGAFQSTRILASEPAPDLPATSTPPHTGDATMGLVGEKPLLLVIEDNADVVTYIAGLLEKEYEIHTAPNGRAGIEKAYELVPDIIISDVMMPEKDGYEVCETLKHDERTSHIPIILLTAKAESSDRILGLRKGADAYLMKPFNKEELYVRLEKLLELRRALQQRYAGERFDKFSKFVKSNTAAEPSLEDLFLQKLRNAVLQNLDDPNLGAEQLSRAVLLSPSQLYRKLNALTGEPPNAFIRKIRLHRAMEMLETTELNISEIAYDVGFNDPNYFSRAFSKEFGKAPSEYRN
jgi:YesN/AraC family two-component response regulator